MVTQFCFAPARILEYCSARYCAAHTADCNVVGVHLFSFGGVGAAATWMNRIIAARGSS